MNAGGIDAQRITSMLAQLKATAQGAGNAVEKPSSVQGLNTQTNTNATSKVSFSDALKASLDNVNQMQVNSEKLGKEFTMGNDNVSLSDVMITGQKANIAFQATVQVRNKLVSAYQDMMNMQV